MTEIIFQSKRTMVVEIAGIVHFISTMPGKHARPFQTTISVNGSCCMMDGPLSVPDSCAAMTAVTMWALRRDSPSNPEDQLAGASPAQLRPVVGRQSEDA